METSGVNTLTPVCSEINKILNNPEMIPKFLMKGPIYMELGNDETKDPQMCRPITCLNTLYKIITPLVPKQLSYHIKNNTILTDEQKVCRMKTQCCKELMIIDRVIAKNAKNSKRNIDVTWLDYQEAFDLVLHSYLITIFETCEIDAKK